VFVTYTFSGHTPAPSPRCGGLDKAAQTNFKVSHRMPRSQQQQQILGVLEAVERAATWSLRFFLFVVMGAIIGVVVLAVLKQPFGNAAQGEWFYFGGFALLALCWALGGLHQLNKRSRRRREQRAVLETRVVQTGNWPLDELLRSAGPGAVEVQADGGTKVVFSKTMEIPGGSIPTELLPDERQLALIESELRRGASLDDACRLMQREYAGWPEMQRLVYRTYVEHQLREKHAELAAPG
jgi:hypothetical protein